MTQPIDPGAADTQVPIGVPAADPTDASVNQLAGTIQTMIDNALAGVQKSIKGVITANNLTASPPTVDLTLSGDTTVIPGVRYMDDYSPVVGDTVIVEKQGSDIFVLGQMNSTTTSSDPLNGWTTIPTLGSGFTNAGGSAKYRLTVDSGDTMIQWRGAVNISGTPTAVCTMPAGAIPASNRQVTVATSTGPAVLLVNSDGTVVFQPVSGTVTGTSASTTPGATGSAGGHTHTVFDDHTHSHGGAVSTTSFVDSGTDSQGSHTHTGAAHTHGAGSFVTASNPTYFSLEGVYYYL